MAHDPSQMSDAEALAVLDWYRAAGVDIAVGDEPVDRFAASAVAPVKRVLPAAAGPAPAPPPAAPLVTDPAETREIAAAATTLEQLRAAMEAYDGCVLKHRATQLVFADGNPQAQIMMVGEGPGEQEDKQGKPFVGRAGQLLDRMLAAIGLDRTKVYIANMVPWRPPGNRNPTPDELAQCAPFLHRQVELVNPKLMVTLGNVPTQALFATSQGITRMRGQWKTLEINNWSGPVLPTLHPAFLLRTPSAKAQAWKDMLSLKQAIVKQGIRTS
ncbi:uracil-DNA glycosylase [Devosia sp. 66-22]|uniref:uracil-DNA glycosylase n=1 Tax=Devosia sp. 66-22 TaxID=1895753 RepID=UPI000927C46E|nr:uracil-DNA glycosylase [Devosia sp. 66-22]OJX51314.1 MAG: uracil-DNA glycosylase [Devosia sp. 66-22]